MGLATFDPYSHKVQTKLYKIPKFGVHFFVNFDVFKSLYLSQNQPD